MGLDQKPLPELEMELARVKRELAEVKMERDLLKKAAAYFRRHSQTGALEEISQIESWGNLNSALHTQN